jgi:hypothetical protein
MSKREFHGARCSEGQEFNTDLSTKRKANAPEFRQKEGSVNVDDIARALKARRSGSCWMAKCPAHDDRNPSLSIRDDGAKVLVRCHAGCSQRAVSLRIMSRGPDVSKNPDPPGNEMDWRKSFPSSAFWPD